VPAALSQGRTLDELKENLSDALRLIFETNRESVRAEYKGEHLIEEVIVFP
jgi:predicted RNase H-like HicB family nuclease